MCAIEEIRRKEREKAESPSNKEKRRDGRNTTQAFLRVKGGDKTGRLVDG